MSVFYGFTVECNFTDGWTARFIFMHLQTLKRWLLGAIAVLALLTLLTAAAIQFYLFPHIDQFKPRIREALSSALQRPVRIDKIDVQWQGIHPELSFNEVVFLDQQQRPALQLQRVSASLSWSSMLLLSPKLSTLRIERPDLTVRRTVNDELFLAGLSMSGPSHPEFANWLLAQPNIQIQHAKITWVDEKRNAPPLSLQDLNLEIDYPSWQRLLGRRSLHLDSMVSVGTRERLQLDAIVIGHDIAQLSDWQATLQLKLPHTDLSVWHPWLTMPLQVHQGVGQIDIQARLARGHVQSLQSRLDVKQLSISSAHHTEPVIADYLRGEWSWQMQDNGQRLQLKQLSAEMHPGIRIKNLNADWKQQGKDWQGDWRADQLALEDSSALLDMAVNDWGLAESETVHMLKAMAPAGSAREVHLVLQRKQDQWRDYRLDAQLRGISSLAYQQIPGIQNWSGQLKIKPHQGVLVLDTEQASIDTAGLLRYPLPISKLKGKVTWADTGSQTIFSTKQLAIENPHAALRLDAIYQLGSEGGDRIDLHGEISRGNAKFAPFYYPNILGETTLHWLDTSILAGHVQRGEVIVRGRVKDFPFVNHQQHSDPALGLFRVTAQVTQAQLEYGTGWPYVNDLQALLKFEGKRMAIDVHAGNTVGHQIVRAHAEIPQLDADDPILSIQSQLKGKVENGVKFVNSSPVKEVAMGFTDHLKTSGDADLALDMQIPLNDVEASHYQGDYSIKNGHIDADDGMGLPMLDKINGHLKFTEKGLQAQNVSLQLFDNPAVLQSLSSRPDKSVVIQASGRINDSALRKLDSNLLTAALHGSTDWKANLLIQKPRVQLEIRSQLNGLASSLPPPFAKAAELPANLLINLRQENNQQDTIEIQYDHWINAKLSRRHDGNQTRISGGDIAINTPARLPADDTLSLHADIARLNVDDWLAYLKTQPSENTGYNASSVPIKSIEVSAGVMQIFERNLHQIKLQMTPGADKLKLAVQAQELAGEADWFQGKQNKLIAKLDYLRIPRSNSTGETKAPTEIRRLTSAYPEIELSAQDFQFGEKNLGQLAVKAFNSGDNWVIQHMSIVNADSQLLADGVWRNTVRNPQTQLKFTLNSSNLGKTFQRFQPGELIKGGTANMSAQLGWPGSPHEFAVERLDGNFKLQLEKGQILKVQPGVGRLLGLLSLQSLPRRLTLDFRDLFSEGFAFDRINCTANINDGILRSQDLFMTGPAADATIKGETNLKTETQQLKIKVAPHVSDTLSLAALAGGPIVGVAAFVAQKLLKDPLNKITSSEYMITGTWDNPQEVDIDKVIPNNAKP